MTRKTLLFASHLAKMLTKPFVGFALFKFILSAQAIVMA